MLKFICFVLFAVLSVSSIPIGPLACNSCPFNNPGNNNPYNQANTVQIPGIPGPIGNSLNQVILSKILSNPSLQKIIDPNTRLYNQNGQEVRQAKNAGQPNVINNYFIVPPEVFDLNNTDADEITVTPKNKDCKKNNKTKRKITKIEDSLEDEDETVIDKPPVKRKSETDKKKKSKNKLEVIDELENDEVNTRKQRDNAKTEKESKVKVKKNAIVEEVVDDDIIEQIIKANTRPVTQTPRKKNRKNNKPANKNTQHSQAKKTRKNRKPKEQNKKNIKETAAPKQKNNRENKQKTNQFPNDRNINPYANEFRNGYYPYMPMNYFDPYSYYPYNFNQYYPYQDPNIQNNYGRKNKKKSKNDEKMKLTESREVQNRKINTANIKNNKKKNRQSNTHTIEIELKPKKKELIKEEVVVTTAIPIETTENVLIEEEKITEKVIEEKPKVAEKIVELLVESTTEEESKSSIEEVTDIPMEMPHKVSLKPFETSSTESYETYSKLENLLDFNAPDLGDEEEVPTIDNNDIIDDYYPHFEDDDYFNPHVENLDDRYYYETENKEKKKLDRYENTRKQRDGTKQMLENPDFITKKVRKVDKKTQKDSEEATLEQDTIKSSAEIIRVTVPAKIIPPKVENVETVFAGSKVAKYGVNEDSEENVSANVEDSEESSEELYPAYIIATSVGRVEDYY